MFSISCRIAIIRRVGCSLLAVGLLGLVLAGCVRLLEPRPGQNITYYLLDGGLRADTASTDSTGLDIGLRRPRLASYLDASRIVSRRGPNSIQFSDFHRWGEDLDRGINRVFAFHLEQKPGIHSVEAVPWSGEARFDYVVQLHVLRFEGVGPSPPGPKADDDAPPPTGHSQMVVRWTILGPDGTNTQAKGITRHRNPDWPVTDYADLTAKLGTSLDVLADDVASKVKSLPAE